MTVAVVRATWTGGPSSPGVSTFCLDYDGVAVIDDAQASIRGFLANLGGMIPTGYSVQVEQLTELYDEATGQLTGEYNAAAAVAPVTGAATGVYAAGVGFRVDWSTATIRNGRRVRGRTFVVPVQGGSFQEDGTINTPTRDGVQTAASALISNLAADGAPFVIWSRPSQKYPVGALADVVAAKVPDKAAWLRGRRG